MSAILEKIINEICELPPAVETYVSAEHVNIVSIHIDDLRRIIGGALRPHDAVADAEPLVCYFKSAQDRDEFIQAMQEAMPGMSAVAV